MAVTALVMELGKIAERVQEQATNEACPWRGEPILDETSQGKTLDELRANASQMRRALIDAARTLPDAAFEAQAPDADGRPVWSAGEVITHCNGVLTRFADRAADMAGVDPPGWTAAQLATGEQRLLDREAAIAAVEAVDPSAWLAAIPADADLESAVDHPAFGKMSARAWLHFMAVHEANHVEQLEELRAEPSS